MLVDSGAVMYLQSNDTCYSECIVAAVMVSHFFLHDPADAEKHAKSGKY